MRASSRSFVALLLVIGVSAALLQPASARPRSWFLPPLSVACVTDDGPTETFSGSMQLNAASVEKGELSVGGTIAGSCGEVSLDTLFRTAVAVSDASCAQATLTLADITIRDTLVQLSEDPIVISAEDGDRNLRGALCAVGAATSGPLKAQARTLNRLLALQG